MCLTQFVFLCIKISQLILYWFSVLVQYVLHKLYLTLHYSLSTHSLLMLIVTIPTINETSSLFPQRVCLCRRGRLKTDWPTLALGSPFWPGRDKPPTRAAPIQATSSKLPQGRWQQGRKMLWQNYLTNPLNFYTVHVPFFWGTLFPLISNGSSCFLHSAYWFIFFFFSSRSDPWGRDARQDCPNLAPLFFFLSLLSIFYPDTCDDRLLLFHTAAYLIGSD